MRIIDYFNIAAAIMTAMIVISTVIIFFKIPCSAGPSSACSTKKDRLYTAGTLFFIILGAFLRLYNLEGLPYGLQQDEASIGYEAFCLAHYGIDRNGFHWPVYPITWGSGGGSPLMIYMNVITTKLFGSRVFSIRFVTGFLGAMTIVLFYAFLRKIKDSRTAFLGTAALAIMPWHIMISRFSLDSNTAPFFVMLATFVFLLGVRSGKTGVYAASAALYGLCLYSYGSANIVIPLYLIIICVFCIFMGKLSIRQLLISMGCFIAVVIPLGIFYAVNFLGLPEISLSWISFPKFTSSHFGSVFIPFDSSFPAKLASNLKGLLSLLTIGLEGEVRWNDMPSYATLYRFTFPVTFLGFGVMAARIHKGVKNREFPFDSIMMALLISSLIFSLIIEQDMNRSVFLYLPLIYCFTVGLGFIFDTAQIRLWQSSKHKGAVFLPGIICIILLAFGFISFSKDYYGGYYNNYASFDFMPGYGEAMCRANEIAEKDNETVYSTYTDVASPFMLTLYYTQYDPYDFLDTVVYKDPLAEFRIASSFGHFIFGLPDGDLTGPEYKKDVFVVTGNETDMFPENEYTFEKYGNFTVVYLSK